LLSAISDAETASRGFVVTGDEQFLAHFEPGSAGAGRHLDDVRALTGDDPEQQTRVDQLEPLVAEKFAFMRRINDLRRTAGVEAAAAEVSEAEGRDLMDRIRLLAEGMATTESRLLEGRLAEAHAAARGTIALLIGLFLLALGMAILLVVMFRRDLLTREEAAAKFLDLYNRAPCGYYTIDRSGLIVSVNDTALAWLGYTREEVAGRMSVVELLKAQRREVFATTFDRFRHGEDVIGRETALMRKDGTLLPVLYNASIQRDARGGFLAARITIFDITERKKAEQFAAQARSYAESIVETVVQPIVILTADLQINSANRSFYQLFELKPEEVLGRNLRELLDGQFAVPELLQSLEEILPEHTQLDDFELRLNLARLGRRTLRLNARKLHRPGNNTTMMLLAIEDVTLRRQAG